MSNSSAAADLRKNESSGKPTVSSGQHKQIVSHTWAALETVVSDRIRTYQKRDGGFGLHHDIAIIRHRGDIGPDHLCAITGDVLNGSNVRWNVVRLVGTGCATGKEPELLRSISRLRVIAAARDARLVRSHWIKNNVSHASMILLCAAGMGALHVAVGGDPLTESWLKVVRTSILNYSYAFNAAVLCCVGLATFRAVSRRSLVRNQRLWEEISAKTGSETIPERTAKAFRSNIRAELLSLPLPLAVVAGDASMVDPFSEKVLGEIIAMGSSGVTGTILWILFLPERKSSVWLEELRRTFSSSDRITVRTCDIP